MPHDKRRTRPPARPAGAALTLALAAIIAARAAAAEPPQPAWKRHTIDDSSRGADGVRLADVNGDKLPDVATGWEEGGVTRVYVNPGPAKAAGKWPAVTVGRTPSVEDAVLVDLDGDRRLDVVTCCEGRTRALFVHWAPKDPRRYLDAAAWRTQPLPASQNAMMWMFCLPMRLDGRGRVDLVAAGKGRGAKVGYFRSPPAPRDLGAWTWHPLIDAAWIMSLVATDMDADGDLDVVISERKGKRSGCYWLERPDEAARLATPWTRHWIGSRGRQVMFLCLADLDGDGLRDVLAAQKPRHVIWHRRRSKDGRQWSSHAIDMPASAGTAKAVNVGDIDLDGRLDVVFTCEGAGGKSGVMWLSPPAKLTQPAWRAHDISSVKGGKYDLVELIDLDADGDLDAMTCEERELNAIVWYENPHRTAPSVVPTGLPPSRSRSQR